MAKPITPTAGHIVSPRLPDYCPHGHGACNTREECGQKIRAGAPTVCGDGFGATQFPPNPKPDTRTKHQHVRVRCKVSQDERYREHDGKNILAFGIIPEWHDTEIMTVDASGNEYPLSGVVAIKWECQQGTELPLCTVTFCDVDIDVDGRLASRDAVIESVTQQLQHVHDVTMTRNEALARIEQAIALLASLSSAQPTGETKR